VIILRKWEANLWLTIRKYINCTLGHSRCGGFASWNNCNLEATWVRCLSCALSATSNWGSVDSASEDTGGKNSSDGNHFVDFIEN